ncbi:unnamed protein product [Lactuca saligna]|uniref:Uncharacterized protein n=1 Tax=Lactuca saligna TaxID=75948 RepID=A0AA35YA13_LACSI|nr:unnamed protein product [Lactuca saligna]
MATIQIFHTTNIIRIDNSKFNFINSIPELMLRDVPTLKTEKVKVLNVKLENVTRTIDELLSERVAVKSCVSDVKSLLSDLIETRDTLIPITVRKHLADKLLPLFAVLNRLEVHIFSSRITSRALRLSFSFSSSSSSKTFSFPLEPETTLPFALGSRGKEKVLDNEEEEEDKNKKLKFKARDEIQDENMCIAREAEEKENDEREAQTALAAKKLLFPPCSLERILNEAIHNPSLHWLEPVTSFKVENTLDSQLNFPITPKSILIGCFDVIANAPYYDANVYKSLMSFYLMHLRVSLMLNSKQLTVLRIQCLNSLLQTYHA